MSVHINPEKLSPSIRPFGKQGGRRIAVFCQSSLILFIFLLNFFILTLAGCVRNGPSPDGAGASPSPSVSVDVTGGPGNSPSSSPGMSPSLDDPVPGKVPPNRYGEDREIMVRKRKYIPREVWDVAGSPSLERERYYFKKALEKDPDNPELLYFLGFNFMEGHIYDRAVVYFKRALKLEPGHKLARENLVFSCLQMSDYKSAGEEAAEGLKRYPLDPRLLYFQALVELYGKKNPGKALELLEKASLKNIRDPRLYQGIAQVYFETGKPGQGIALLERSVGEFPDYPDSHVLLAEKYRDERGEIKKAVNLLEKIIRAVPSHDDSYVLLGDIHLETGNFPGAEKYYMQALKKRPESPGEIYIQLGKTYLEMKKPSDAARWFQKVLETGNDQTGEEGWELIPEAYLGLCRARIQEGDFSQASKYIEKAEKISPDPSAVLLARSDLDFARKDYDRALSFIRRIKSGENNDPDGKELEMEVNLRLSRIYRAKGETKKADWHLDKAIEEAPAYLKDFIRKRAVH